jgi:hypothetical protein
MTRVTRLIKTATLIAPAVVMVGCAGFNRPSTFGLDANSAALVRKTCTEIMGLPVSAEFEACGGSLAETVQFLHRAQLTVHADESCEQQGLAHGTAERAKCVVMFRGEAGRSAALDSLLASNASADSPPFVGVSADSPLRPTDLPAKHYVTMSHSEQQQRAELSCAQVGLHPSWNSFESCVTNLRYALADIRYWNLH